MIGLNEVELSFDSSEVPAALFPAITKRFEEFVTASLPKTSSWTF